MLLYQEILMIWSNLDEFFDYINEKSEYVILRNWEDYSSANLLNSEDDIDILCRDKTDFIKAAGTVSLHHAHNRGNYYINIGTRKIRIDIRYIGDGYYCRKWEEKILKNRILDAKGFYVPNPDDYMYSLLYHTLVQKPKLSFLYYEKLNIMFGDIKRNETEFLHVLKMYMDKNHFYVDYPLDKAVFLNMTNIWKGALRINRDIKKELSRKVFCVCNRILRLCAKIIHSVNGRI